jgi:hypothetical protein
MVYIQTPNYKFNEPIPPDTMADPVNQINNTWQKIDAAANPTIITAVAGVFALPTTGYKVGDRVYVEDPGINSVNSTFVCLTDDPIWGNWWLPVQDQSTPWRDIPAAAFPAGYGHMAGDPWQMMINNRGQLYCRGSFRINSGSLPNDTNVSLFGLPRGLDCPTSGSWIGSIDPTNFNASGGTYDQFRAARIYVNTLQNVGSFLSFRVHGATASPATVRVWVNQLRWPIGTGDFTTG